VPAQEPRATAKYCGGELSQTRTERPSAITRIKAAIKAANRKLEELGIEPISERVTPHSLRRFGPRLGMTPCTSRSSSATRTRTSR
jgi:integrase